MAASAPRRDRLIALTSTRVLLSHTQSYPGPGAVFFSPTSGRVVDIQSEHFTSIPFHLVDAFAEYDVSIVNVSPHVILPGLVDTHVHLNSPGRTEWEGFETGTRSAIAGGITTVVDMPLNSIPPTTSVANLKTKVDAAKAEGIWCDVGFWGGIVPENARGETKRELKAMVKSGVRGFKGFLCPSGVDEFGTIREVAIESAMQELWGTGAVVMFHAELAHDEDGWSHLESYDGDGDDFQVLGNDDQGGNAHLATSNCYPKSYMSFLASRPSLLETNAIDRLIRIAERVISSQKAEKLAHSGGTEERAPTSPTSDGPGLKLHIVHLSSAQSISKLAHAAERWSATDLQITAETCHHYLMFSSDSIPDGDTRFKCCPPVRSSKNREALWEDLTGVQKKGVISTIVSDHSPCPPAFKLLPTDVAGATMDERQDVNINPESPEAGEQGDFTKAWGGISSLGLSLPLLNTERRKGRPFELNDVVRWCCYNTAKQAGVQNRKGTLAVGKDADIAVFDDTLEWIVGSHRPSSETRMHVREREGMHWRHQCSPNDGMALEGRVLQTWLRGTKVWDLKEGFVGQPMGRTLLE
ncbi:MAG: hypothetical protein Q9162_001576 [Coniocarpon cinnabarinum]